MRPVIKNWYVTWDKTQGYTLPKLRRKGLIGQVYGDPNTEDGTEVCIVLSWGAKTEGRIITTSDDQVFELGKPEPAYLAWLIESGVGYDEAHPVKIVTKLRHGALAGKRPTDGGRGLN